jgi:acyl-CoA reductase-like NAD-dependent aldehyde dehydrogenase
MQEISEQEATVLDLSIPDQLLNYIGGAFIAPLDDRWIESVNPATAEVLCRVPDSGASDVARAVEAAKKAFPS